MKHIILVAPHFLPHGEDHRHTLVPIEKHPATGISNEEIHFMLERITGRPVASWDLWDESPTHPGVFTSPVIG